MFQEPAPRLPRLLEEGCGVDTEADPWDLLGAQGVTTMIVPGRACAVFVDGDDWCYNNRPFDSLCHLWLF